MFETFAHIPMLTDAFDPFWCDVDRVPPYNVPLVLTLQLAACFHNVSKQKWKRQQPNGYFTLDTPMPRIDQSWRRKTKRRFRVLITCACKPD